MGMLYIITMNNKYINKIRKNPKKFNWDEISADNILSEEFIEEFQDYVDWTHISLYQKLSEDFIIKFQDKVNWVNICLMQNLSENFIRNFKHKVFWHNIFRVQKLSKEFIIEFYDTFVQYSESFLMNEKIDEDIKEDCKLFI